MILELLTTTCNSLEKAEIKYMISGSWIKNLRLNTFNLFNDE